MEAYFFLFLAVIFLGIGHYFKVKRISQFIEIYEEPNQGNLLRSLALANIFNFFLPFRLGYIFRVIYQGRKMKNGYSFSLVSVISDIVLDFFAILFIYLFVYLFVDSVLSHLLFYFGVCILIFVSVIIANRFNNYLKKVIYYISSIFNEHIELKMLKIFWVGITFFKNMLSKVNKRNLFGYSIITWLFYLLSYYTVVVSLNYFEFDVYFVDFFNSLYSFGGVAGRVIDWHNIYNLKNLILLVYIFMSCMIVYGVSFFLRDKEDKHEYLNVLPHISTHNRLVFLKQYFSSGDSNYYAKFIKMNQDIVILEDYSSGSNATTMLCMKDDRLIYRKYAFGDDAKKLYEQINWLQKHQDDLLLTALENVKRYEGCCSYDMPYISNTVTCFNYVHTVQYDVAWKLLVNVFDDLSNNLHKKNVSKAKKSKINSYIEDKVLKNIEKIEKSSYIKPLLKYDYLIVNGKKYHNLSYFKKFLTKSYLEKIFKDDSYSDIHGDFTIENIICFYGDSEQKYYIIDPNTGNLHSSPCLDFAKFLQSVHGGYEFLMNTKECIVNNNEINFVFTKSSVYNQLYLDFKKYLCEKFDKKMVRSIFFHEVVHWLRLLPYKINKNGSRCILFYVGMIMVMEDVIKEFDE